jgi:hypothetical protein
LAKIATLVHLYFKANPQFIEVGVDTLNTSIVRVDTPQPSLLPVDSAPVLTSVVTATVAARAVQDHHVICRKMSHRVTIDAGFVDPALDAKQFTTPTQHFRHKWKAIERAVIVKRREYFIRRSNHNPISDKQPF